jgi:site-specific recombinase XerD
VPPELVRDYLAHLAVHQQVSASTQNQACSAILFLCREVLGVNVEGLSPGVRAKRGERLPVVLSMPETMALLGAMSGTPRLTATLIDGGRLRVTECCELRIKDLDFDQGLVVVRRGKGDKDRATLLAEVGRDELRAHLRESEAQHQIDRRHHMGDSVVQKAAKPAAQEPGIHKPVSVDTLRHSFATHLHLNGVDIRQIQEYLGHANVETTMIYTHVVKEFRTSARSPLDMLRERTGR